MQLSKGVRRKDPTFLAALKKEEGQNGGGANVPKPVQEVLEEFKDVMPAELPKELPPRREVDHAIELEPGAKPPAFAPYHMLPPELEELRRQLKAAPLVTFVPPKHPMEHQYYSRRSMMGRFDYASITGP